MSDYSDGPIGARDWEAGFVERQQAVLALIGTQAPLQEVLEAIVRFVEQQSGGLASSILLADPQQRFLRIAAAPNLPDDYKSGFGATIPIAPGMGPCATAAFLRQPVYTRDSATDEVWKDHRELAARNRVRAVWSTPILGATGAVLGTLAMHNDKPGLPNDEQARLMAAATQLARIAIEAGADRAFVHTVFEEAPFGVLVINAADQSIRVNSKLARLLGYEPAELVGKTLADITPEQDYAMLRQQVTPDNGNQVAVAGRRRYRTKDNRILIAGERVSVYGTPPSRHLVSRVEWAMLQSDDPLERLSRRERQVLQLVIEGHSSKDIAARLHISPTSVDTYRSRIMVKLSIHSTSDLVRFAMDHGLTGKAAA